MNALGFLWLLLIGLSAAAYAESIPVMGLDENGQEKMTYYSIEEYAKGVAQMVNATYEEVMPALRYSQKQGKLWRIREVSLGIGVEISLGVTPIFKLGLAPRFRANFSNSTDPVVP